MSKIPFVDCQGLGGAWSLGTVQAGFEMVHRASLDGGFGDEVVERNRHLLGDKWRQDEGTLPDEWAKGTAGVVCGTPPCFAAGTTVLTSRGLVPIERVRAGDSVYTHQHRWQRVLRTGSKTADTVRVGVTECTPDHRWYSSEWDIRYGGSIDPDAATWTAAMSLPGRGIATPREVQPGLFAVPALSEELWWIVGRWLGDGWVRETAPGVRPARGEVIVCCGHHETDALSARLGGRWSAQHERTTTKFVRSDKEFASFLTRNFGKGAGNKTIPAWALTMPEAARWALLEGYASADGSERHGTIRLSSVSKKLLVGMRMLAVGLGLTASLNRVRPAGTATIEGRAVRTSESWSLDVRRENDGRYTRDEGGFHWTKVRKGLVDAGSQTVYDIEVENDHSYVADGYVVHNCAGFSMMNTRSERGPDNPINHCMTKLVEYGASCWGADGGRGAEIISLESVQGAYKKGRALMQHHRDVAERVSGQRYDMYHVMMSGASVGSAQYRPRYYLVLARVPFGIDEPQLSDIPDGKIITYYDALADLMGLTYDSWDEQPYVYGPASKFASSLRRPDGLVDAHVTKTGALGRIVEEACNRGMKPKWYLSQAFDWLDYHPDEYAKSRGVRKVAREGSTYRGFSWPRRVAPEKNGWVITGGSTREFIHWQEPRLLTIRELSRMMGYPDDWRWPDRSTGKTGALIGKCCPVTSGRWLSTWFRRSLEGDPGWRGTEIGDREYLFDYTRTFKAWERAA